MSDDAQMAGTIWRARRKIERVADASVVGPERLALVGKRLEVYLV
jgi:hypothetical protein